MKPHKGSTASRSGAPYFAEGLEKVDRERSALKQNVPRIGSLDDSSDSSRVVSTKTIFDSANREPE